MNKQILNVALAVALSGSALSANAASYTFTDLGTLGGVSSAATAINNAGQVAGWSYIADFTTSDNFARATVWNGSTGTVTNLGTLGGYKQLNSFASGINNAGQVAGSSQFVLGGNHAIQWNGTIATDLGTLGGTISHANAINNTGQVAGWSFFADNTGATHATVWNGTTATALGTLSTYQIANITSEATAINNAGQVAGWSYAAGTSTIHAIMWNGTTPTDLGTLGGTYSQAFAINDAGQVAGYSDTAGNVARHATVWNGTTATDLNSFLDASIVSAGWVLVEAKGINDNGWIVGNASNSLLGIQSHAFLLSVAAVPEAETWAMMLAGLGLVGFAARRRTALPIIK